MKTSFQCHIRREVAVLHVAWLYAVRFLGVVEAAVGAIPGHEVSEGSTRVPRDVIECSLVVWDVVVVLGSGANDGAQIDGGMEPPHRHVHKLPRCLDTLSQ